MMKLSNADPENADFFTVQPGADFLPDAENSKIKLLSGSLLQPSRTRIPVHNRNRVLNLHQVSSLLYLISNQRAPCPLSQTMRL